MGTVGATECGAAEALLDQADRTPDEVAVRAAAMAEATDDPRTASVAWRAAGIGLRLTGRIHESLAAFDRSVLAAEEAGDRRLGGLARTSRAAPRFMSGDMDGGLADLRAAFDELDGGDLGVAVFQHAQYLDVVEDPAAGDEFGRAVGLLTGSPPHAKYLGHTLANRGLHHTAYGRFEEAYADYESAARIWTDLGLEALAATVEHNIGMVALYRGDFVDALDRFEAAQRRSATLSQHAGAAGRDYCDALLAVGLAAEARDRAVELAQASDATGDELAAAELRLLAAHAALQVGDAAATEELAASALGWFERAGRPGWAAHARLALARAAMERGAAEPGEIERLADDLEARGWQDPALHARLLAVESLGDTAAARAALDTLAARLRSARAERRLQADTIDAGLAVAEGAAARARRAVRRGLAVVEHEQRSVGAIDARAHFASHAADLLRLGRTVAIGHRDARTAWLDLERMRALSLRRPRVRPVDDAELGALLARLRRVSVELEVEEPGTPAAAALAREQRRLQRQAADHVRRTPGESDDAPDADLDDIAALLGRGDGSASMITFDVVGDRLWAFVFDGRMRRVDCGAAAAVLDRVAAVEMTVRRLARRTASAHSVAVGMAQLLDLIDWFDAHLPMRRTDGPVVLVVPGELTTLPWASLPSLHGRPIAIAPSAWTWANASRRQDAVGSHAAFVAGPGLPMAAAEVDTAAAAHRHAEVLRGDFAVVPAAADALERSTLVHVAAHYAPRRGNPLFSAFQLADGPWFLHDLTRCTSMPSTWVVPSCESSIGEAPVAGELLGLSAVLLGAGVRSVVLASGLVPDDAATVDTMTELHRRLASGEAPSSALATALAELDDAPAAAVLRATLACHGAW